MLNYMDGKDFGNSKISYPLEVKYEIHHLSDSLFSFHSGTFVVSFLSRSQYFMPVTLFSSY